MVHYELDFPLDASQTQLKCVQYPSQGTSRRILALIDELLTTQHELQRQERLDDGSDDLYCIIVKSTNLGT